MEIVSVKYIISIEISENGTKLIFSDGTFVIISNASIDSSFSCRENLLEVNSNIYKEFKGRVCSLRIQFQDKEE